MDRRNSVAMRGLGQFEMRGAFYGETGEFASGAVGGTLSTELGDMTMGGVFYLETGELIERCGPEC